MLIHTEIINPGYPLNFLRVYFTGQANIKRLVDNPGVAFIFEALLRPFPSRIL